MSGAVVDSYPVLENKTCHRETGKLTCCSVTRLGYFKKVLQKEPKCLANPRVVFKNVTVDVKTAVATFGKKYCLCIPTSGHTFYLILVHQFLLNKLVDYY